jgi:hypothetical protein
VKLQLIIPRHSPIGNGEGEYEITASMKSNTCRKWGRLGIKCEKGMMDVTMRMGMVGINASHPPTLPIFHAKYRILGTGKTEHTIF